MLFINFQFAMGLNMPAKTVVFTAVKKWDGDSHRYIGSGEYIQVTCYLFNLSFLGLIFIEMLLLLDEWTGWSPWQG